MPKTTIDSRGMTTTKVIAARLSTVKAIIIAPTTTNGERKSRRRVRLSPL